jgi:regulator of CtrA degradation
MTGLFETRNGKQNESLVDFLARFTSSEQFEKVFREGMGLVEETANYLDGDGRIDARGLDRHGAIAYATESMRLTTRLMQLASWLLLQRAVSSGELTPEDARKEKHRISLAEIGAGQPLTGSSQLPAALGDLIARSLRLHERIMKLDAMITARARREQAGPSPVSGHLDRLAQVFKLAR